MQDSVQNQTQYEESYMNLEILIRFCLESDKI